MWLYINSGELKLNKTKKFSCEVTFQVSDLLGSTDMNVSIIIESSVGQCQSRLNYSKSDSWASNKASHGSLMERQDLGGEGGAT